jgi:hypothetical protein
MLQLLQPIKRGEKDKTFLVEWANADLVFKKHGKQNLRILVVNSLLRR